MADEITKLEMILVSVGVLVRAGYNLEKAAEILRDLAQNDSEMQVLTLEEAKRLIKNQLEKTE